MIPGTEPCEHCHGSGVYGVHSPRCWKCKGTGIQLCQYCAIHAAEFTTKQTKGAMIPQGDPGRVRFACGLCIEFAEAWQWIREEPPGLPDIEIRKEEVEKMDRATGLILHRKRELEDKEYQSEFGLSDDEEEELEALKREFPLPNYKGFVHMLAELGCKGMQQQPYPCEDLPDYDERLWCISCHARKLVQQEKAVTV
jgi:hypothetical protein